MKQQRTSFFFKNPQDMKKSRDPVEMQWGLSEMFIIQQKGVYPR